MSISRITFSLYLWGFKHVCARLRALLSHQEGSDHPAVIMAVIASLLLTTRAARKATQQVNRQRSTLSKLPNKVRQLIWPRHAIAVMDAVAFQTSIGSVRSPKQASKARSIPSSEAFIIPSFTNRLYIQVPSSCSDPVKKVMRGGGGKCTFSSR